MKTTNIVVFSTLILFVGLFVVLFVLWAHKASRPPEIAEGVESVDWLPAEATNINYFRSYVYTAYEFQISESGFREWAAKVTRKPSSEDVMYQPLTDTGDLREDSLFTVQRYNLLLGKQGDHGVSSDDPEHVKATSIEIKNGLVGGMRRGSGGGYAIGYDRETGMAYFQFNPR